MRTNFLTVIVLILACVLAGTAAEGRLWYVAVNGLDQYGGGAVGSPFASIQYGLNWAVAGDTVLVADGTYTGSSNTNIDFQGRRVVLRSASDNPEKCVIDCRGIVYYSRGFQFRSGEDSTSIVRGLKVINGYVDDGAGVLCESASPKFVNCVFAFNRAGQAGGGVKCRGGRMIAENCTFIGNYGANGGGAAVVQATPQFRNCTFRDNTGISGGGIAYIDCSSMPTIRGCTFTGNLGSGTGGAISLSNSSLLVQSCTLTRNSSVTGSGIDAWGSSAAMITQTIIAFGHSGAAVHCANGAEATMQCSNICGNEGGDYVGCLEGLSGVGGNIQVDPQFCDETHGNFGIWAASSCAPGFAGDCGLIGVAGPSCGTPTAVFTNVTAGALAGGDMGYGVAVGDYDADGDDDLYVVNDGTANRLLRNDGGGVFANAAPPVLADVGRGRAAAWADVDNDGDLDLYLSKDGEPNRLFRNQGAGAFTDITMFPIGDAGAGRAVSWVDQDLDGKLDLYLVNEGGSRLFRGLGDFGSPYWFFGAIGSAVINDPGNGIAASWGDVDNDGDQDLFLSRTLQTKLLLRNDPQLGFEDATVHPLDDAGSGAGVAWGDYNSDGRLDLYVANRTTPDRLFRQYAGGFTLVAGGAFGQLRKSTSVAWADFDNDGDLDLFLGRSPGADALLRNDGAAGFTELALMAAGLETPTTGAAWLDFDNDGDLDLYIVRNGAANALLRNDTPAGNHWLQLVLRGTTANRSAIGARVRTVAGGQSRIREVTAGDGYLSQGSLVVSFGLGSAAVVDTVEIRWPGGGRQVLTGVAADRRLAITQGGPSPVDLVLPQSATIALFPCRPNPFNAATTIEYELALTGTTRLAVYDLGGRLVRILIDGVTQTAGRHLVTWNGCDDDDRTVAAGTYVCRLQAGEHRAVQLLTLLK
jgi:hypothetical protein